MFYIILIMDSFAKLLRVGRARLKPPCCFLLPKIKLIIHTHPAPTCDFLVRVVVGTTPPLSPSNIQLSIVATQFPITCNYGFHTDGRGENHAPPLFSDAGATSPF